MTNIINFSTEKHSAEELISHMINFFARQNMLTQRLDSPDGIMTIIQARISGGQVKQFVGMDRAVTLRFTKGDSHVNVETGEAKWTDKAIVMTLSMFVLCPLTLTSGIGIYKQRKLVREIPEEMSSFMTDTVREVKPGIIARGLTAVSDTAKKVADVVTDKENIRAMQKATIKLAPLIVRELGKVMSR